MKWLLLLVIVAVPLLLWAPWTHAAGKLAEGQGAPDFSLQDQDGARHTLLGYRGRWVVLYFYPKDDTPGCTQQACSFRDDWRKLTSMGAQVLGVSVDDTRSHAAFARKYQLPFPLLADGDGAVAARYDSLLNLGVTRFARRHTFLIDPDGRIARIYRKVDTSRHSEEIIKDLGALTRQ